MGTSDVLVYWYIINDQRAFCLFCYRSSSHLCVKNKVISPRSFKLCNEILLTIITLVYNKIPKDKFKTWFSL